LEMRCANNAVALGLIRTVFPAIQTDASKAAKGVNTGIAGSRWHRHLALFPADRQVPAWADDLRRTAAAGRDGVALATAMGCVMVSGSAV
jgi:hypothetical protein